MKKHRVYLSVLFAALVATNSLGKNPDSRDVDVLRGIADRILADTEFSFTDTKTGERYERVKDLSLSPDVKVTSAYNEWKYQNGVINLGLLKLSELTGDDKYKAHVHAKYDFILNSGNMEYFEKQIEAIKSGEVDGKPSREFAKLRGKTGNASFWQLFRLKKLDDCGSQGAALIEVYKEDQEGIYLKYIERFATFIRDEECRLEDGTLARPIPREYTVWVDDLYMSVPFMARYAALTGDTEMMDDAVFQLLRYFDLLFDEEKGLYFHCYFTELDATGVAHWGRANGWVIGHGGIAVAAARRPS
jgi:unsaturated rhamnogalacturonyl hydrolase